MSLLQLKVFRWYRQRGTRESRREEDSVETGERSKERFSFWTSSRSGLQEYGVKDILYSFKEDQ